MKKLLSAIIVLAMVLTLSLSLASCNVLTQEAQTTANGYDEKMNGEGQKEQGEPYRDHIRSELQINERISAFLGEGFCKIGLTHSAPETLYGLYVLDDNARYCAYIITRNEYGVESEGVSLFHSNGEEIMTELWNTELTDNFSEAVDAAARYVASFELNDETLMMYAEQMICDYYGEGHNVDVHYVYSEGVGYVYSDISTNCYVAYIDTFNSGSSSTGVKALVLFHYGYYESNTGMLEFPSNEPVSDSFSVTATSSHKELAIEGIRVFYYKFSSDAYGNEPSSYEAEQFFDEFSGKLVGESKYVNNFENCDNACSDFKDAIEYSFYTIEEIVPTGFDAWIYETFGPGTDLKMAKLGLIIVGVIILIIVAILLLIPVVIVGIIIIVVIIVIATVVKKRKKKKPAALEKEQSYPKAEEQAAEANAEETPAQEPADTNE